MIRFCYFAFAALLTAVGLALVGNAQIVPAVKFHAPMAFQLAGAALPAGEYSVRTVSLGQDSPVLLVESSSGARVTVMAEKVDTPTKEAAGATMVKLERNAETMRLTHIWVAGQAFGYKILSRQPANGAAGHAPATTAL